MAVQVNKNQGSNEPAEQKSNQTSESVPRRTISFGSVLTRFSAQQKLSSMAVDYIAELESRLKESNSNITRNNHSDIELDTISFCLNDNHIILTFAESFTNEDGAPPTEYITEVVNSLRAQDKAARILDNIVVVPQDYPLVDRMAKHIATAFEAHDSEGNEMQIEDFADEIFRVNTNPRSVRSYIESQYPQAAVPRTDSGIRIDMRVTRTDEVTKQTRHHWLPVCAVGTYVRFISTQSNGYGGEVTNKYLPVVTVSTIVAEFPSTAIIPLALSVAVDYLIRRDGWITPYLSFGKDEPNLGVLIPTPDGKKFHLGDRDQLSDFRKEYLVPPVFAIDICDGRPRILGLEKFVDTPEGVHDDICKFLNIAYDPSNKLIVDVNREFTGIITGEKDVSVEDSKIADFVNLVCMKNFKAADIQCLLFKADNPKLKSDKLAEIYSTNYSTIYTNYCVFLNGLVLTTMANRIANVIDLRWDNQGTLIDNSVAPLLNEQYSNFQNFGPMGARNSDYGWNQQNHRTIFR